MTIQKSKLSMAVCSALAALLVSACGGGGSSGGEFNAAEDSLVEVSGTPTSPSEVVAPETDPDNQTGKLVVTFVNDDYSSNGTLQAAGKKLNLYLWASDCDASVTTLNDGWNDISVVPATQNEYGVVWELDVSDDTKNGCMNVIVRDESLNKLTNNSKFVWTADDRSIATYKNASASTLSIKDAFSKIYGVSVDPKDTSGHFLTSKIIVWANDNASSYNARLHYNTDVVATTKKTVTADDGTETVKDVLTGDFINLKKIAFPADLAAKYPHLSTYQAYELETELTADQLKAALRQDLEIVGLDNNNQTKILSKVQHAPLIDELYDATAVNDLGATLEGSSATFKIWAPTAQTMKVHVWEPDNEWADLGKDMVLDATTGVWSATVDGVAQGLPYKYETSMYYPYSHKVETQWFTDPYSLALDKDGEHSILVDLDDADVQPSNWASVVAPHSQETATDIAGMLITESHIRDLTVGPDKGITAANQGKFVGLTETGSNVYKHLSDLATAGVTHLELLPLFDIATVREDISGNADIDLTVSAFCDKAGVQEASILGASCTDNTKTVREVMNTYVEGLSGDDDNELSDFIATNVKNNDSYNWGYDPYHYGAPENSYATATDGLTAVKEMREMIQTVKSDIGMNVIMDVVYNHTNGKELGDQSVLDKSVPLYYHRLSVDTGSVFADTCCSDTAAEHKMMAKLMEDTLVTWAKDYKVDAFRFDLMTYMPKAVMVETLKNVRERSGNSEIVFFGEGWDAGSAAARFESSNQINMAGTGIGTFSDRMRDAVRGTGPFDHGDSLIKGQGFAAGICSDSNGKGGCASDTLHWQDVVRLGMAGNFKSFKFIDYTGNEIYGKDVSYWGAVAGYADEPTETISYVSKHDNPTLFDLIMYKANTERTMEEKAKMQLIGLATVLLGQGIAFDQQGTDLLRTKLFENDSYNSGDFSNLVNYSSEEGNSFHPYAFVNKEKDIDDKSVILWAGGVNTDVGSDVKAKMAEGYQKLATIRKNHPIIHLGTAELVNANVKFLNTGASQIPGLIVMQITRPATGFESEAAAKLTVVLNARPTAQKLANYVGSSESVADTGEFNSGCTVESAPAWGVCVYEQL